MKFLLSKNPFLKWQKILILVIGGIFIILGFLFYFWQKGISLINFIPAHADFYLEINYPFWSTSKNKILDLPITNELYQEVDKILDFKDINFKSDLSPLIFKQAAIAILPSFKNDVSKNTDTKDKMVLILRIKDEKTIKPFLSKFRNVFLRKNILIISNSQEALEAVIKTKNKKIISLNKKINSHFFNDFLRLFVTKDFLKEHLNLKDYSFSYFNYLITNNNIFAFYLEMNKVNNQWRFKTVPLVVSKKINQPKIPFQILNNFSLSKLINYQRRPLNYFFINPINYLPENFLFSVWPINLIEIFQSWGKIESDLAISLNKTFDNFLALYEFDFSKNILSIFNRDAQLIIIDKYQPGILPFDFLIILPPMPPMKLIQLEEVIKIVLANKLPKEIIRTLPDSTTVVELITQFDKFIFEKDFIRNFVIKYIKVPEINFEFAYIDLKSKIILASNKNLMVETVLKYLNSKNFDDKIISQCRLGHEGLIFNFKNLSLKEPQGLFKYLLTEIIFITKKGDKIKGCLLTP